MSEEEMEVLRDMGKRLAEMERKLDRVLEEVSTIRREVRASRDEIVRELRSLGKR